MKENEDDKNVSPEKSELEKSKSKPPMPKRLKTYHTESQLSKMNNSNMAKKELSKQLEDGFLLTVQGMIEGGNFDEDDCIYCKYDIVFGQDWELINQNVKKTGQSQQACKASGPDNDFVWNMPFEIGFKSTNPSGWPKLVISCFCPDYFGREVVKAYGFCFFPTTTGIHERTLYMFSPLSSSGLINAVGIFLGQKAEIINAPDVLGKGEGREVMRTQPEGTVNVTFNVILTNMENFGYNS